MPRSYRPMILAAGETKWAGNGLRFATAREALEAACLTWQRWGMAIDYSIDPSDDEPNYRMVDGVPTSLQTN